MKLYVAEDATALGPIRHTCHSCGTCCTGWRVQLPNEEDRANVIAQALVLGIPNPIVESENAIRREKGSCVFLREDKLCAIHARFGAEAKPRICQHFPRRSMRAEDGVRAGADPGCTSSWKTFADGPELAAWSIVSPPSENIAPDMNVAERGLVRMCLARDMSIPLFSAIISQDHEHLPGLSPGLVGRMLLALKATPPILELEENGPLLTALLAPAVAFVKACDPNTPPPWPQLSKESEAFALDLMARHLFLRFGDAEVAPIARVMCLLAGVFVLAFVNPAPEVFGPALSAWSRAVRVKGFWLLFVSNPATARRMLYGLPGPSLPAA